MTAIYLPGDKFTATPEARHTSYKHVTVYKHWQANLIIIIIKPFVLITLLSAIVSSICKPNTNYVDSMSTACCLDDDEVTTHAFVDKMRNAGNELASLLA